MTEVSSSRSIDRRSSLPGPRICSWPTNSSKLRGRILAASENLKLYRRRTILFLDEIHRFNKAQQDALLPHVEKGLLTLIGATTENPSFEVNSALLSRVKVFVLERLEKEHLQRIVERALEDRERGLGGLGLELSAEARELLLEACDGDARWDDGAAFQGTGSEGKDR